MGSTDCMLVVDGAVCVALHAHTTQSLHRCTCGDKVTVSAYMQHCMLVVDGAV
jgi:hypothetical protein